MGQYNNTTRQWGVSIYLALVIMFILLGIGLSLSTLLIGQMKVIRGMGYSVVALYAADTGIEGEIYWRKNFAYHVFLDFDGNGSSPVCEPPAFGLCPGSCPTPFDSNDACYQVTVLSIGAPGCIDPNITVECIQSIGIYRGVRRAIKASW